MTRPVLRSGPLVAGWTVPWSVEERRRDSGDPLGFRAAANRVARVLAPGLSQRSNSVRGFGLAAFGLNKAREFEDVDSAFLAFERAWVLAQAWHEMEGESVERWAGWQGARRLLDANSDGKRVPLYRRLLNDQLAGVLWGQYRRASVVIGLLRDERGAHTSRPSNTKLTGNGQALAAASKEAAFGSLHVADWLSARQVSAIYLGKVIPFDSRPSQGELHAFEEPLERMLPRLRPRVDDVGRLAGQLAEAAAAAVGGAVGVELEGITADVADELGVLDARVAALKELANREAHGGPPWWRRCAHRRSRRPPLARREHRNVAIVPLP